jgi:hypothetical protein
MRFYPPRGSPWPTSTSPRPTPGSSAEAAGRAWETSRGRPGWRSRARRGRKRCPGGPGQVAPSARAPTRTLDQRRGGSINGVRHRSSSSTVRPRTRPAGYSRLALGSGATKFCEHDRDHKFAEPVALSSAQPADRPLPRRALRRSLNLIALRARRREQPTGFVRVGQAASLAFGGVAPWAWASADYDARSGNQRNP